MTPEMKPYAEKYREKQPGKSWPHGERREPRGKNMYATFAPELSPEMRYALERAQDEAYAAGKREAEEEMFKGELAMLMVGALVGAGVVGSVWHWLA